MEQNTKQIRELTKEIRIGDRVIGGSYPILIQSMTNTKTENVEETVKQILALEKAGCQIIRCTVPTMKAAEAFTEIGYHNAHTRTSPQRRVLAVRSRAAAAADSAADSSTMTSVHANTSGVDRVIFAR